MGDSVSTESNPRSSCKLCGVVVDLNDPHCCPSVPVAPPNPLTCGEQQEVLVLLRYWHEYHRGGLEPDLAGIHFTEQFLDKHLAPHG